MATKDQAPLPVEALGSLKAPKGMATVVTIEQKGATLASVVTQAIVEGNKQGIEALKSGQIVQVDIVSELNMHA